MVRRQRRRSLICRHIENNPSGHDELLLTRAMHEVEQCTEGRRCYELTVKGVRSVRALCKKCTHHHERGMQGSDSPPHFHLLYLHFSLDQSGLLWKGLPSVSTLQSHQTEVILLARALFGATVLHCQYVFFCLFHGQVSFETGAEEKQAVEILLARLGRAAARR